ncbi:MAG: FkbM family methyltransferase [Proteobacteria bacterium]|nr:FkbM family methyltransferase [Pseudomonadota bacterium]
MSAPCVTDAIFDALGEMRTGLRPTRPSYTALKALLIEHFRNSAFARENSGAVPFGPFGLIDLPYRRMGAIDSVDLFGIDELLIFAFYWANRKLYKRTLDVGANLGLHSIVMARAGFNVTAFEPDPVHFDLLSANLARNGAASVTPERAAVSDTDGQLEFVRVIGNTTGSHLAGAKANPYGELERFPVPVRAFAPIAADADFAKVDAEGHEVRILSSVPAATWNKLDVMVEIGTAENAAALFEHFRKLDVGLYPQKIGWARATAVGDLPTSHREGSLFVTRHGRLPWGDA